MLINNNFDNYNRYLNMVSVKTSLENTQFSDNLFLEKNLKYFKIRNIFNKQYTSLIWSKKNIKIVAKSHFSTYKYKLKKVLFFTILLLFLHFFVYNIPDFIFIQQSKFYRNIKFLIYFFNIFLLSIVTTFTIKFITLVYPNFFFKKNKNYNNYKNNNKYLVTNKYIVKKLENNNILFYKKLYNYINKINTFNININYKYNLINKSYTYRFYNILYLNNINYKSIFKGLNYNYINNFKIDNSKILNNFKWLFNYNIVSQHSIYNINKLNNNNLNYVVEENFLKNLKNTFNYLLKRNYYLYIFNNNYIKNIFKNNYRDIKYSNLNINFNNLSSFNNFNFKNIYKFNSNVNVNKFNYYKIKFFKFF